MATSIADEAILQARERGRAFLKFIAPNDTALTGSNQKGIYLAIRAWPVFAQTEPPRGVNADYPVTVEWHDGRITNSTVKWYGLTKNEYRLTGFNREKNFPHLADDKVGSLFVLVPTGERRFRAFVLEDDDDILEVQAALGIEMTAGKPAVFNAELAGEEGEITDRRLVDLFQQYAEDLLRFPPTAEVSRQALNAIRSCIPTLANRSLDDQLSTAIREEYRLFRIIERRISGADIARASQDLDEFISIAQTILQRRKSRAGRSLEFHVEHLLQNASVPFEAQPRLDGTQPDIVIPSAEAYNDAVSPADDLYIIGIKTTCKDRWRQVLREAPKIRRKHILTLQPGISPSQMAEMSRSDVRLIVPEALHNHYVNRDKLTTVDGFIRELHYKFVTNPRL